MKRAVFSMAGFGAVLLAVAFSAEPEVLVKDDFETNPDTGAFAEGAPVHLNQGWEVFSGLADITVSESWSGQQSLRLKAGEPVAHAMRLVPPPSGALPRFWVEFRLRPALHDEPGLTTVSVFGAKLAFSKSGDATEVWAYDAATNQPVPAVAMTGPAGWFHLIFEVEGESWRLHGEDGPETDWLGLDGGGLAAIHWFGDSTEDIFLDDLQVVAGGVENPFIATTQPGDASRDRPEETLGATNAALAGPTLLAGDEGAGELGLSGGGFSLQSGGSPAIIYVNGNTGSDLNDGESPSTAKATITAGISAVANGGAVIVAPFSTGYTPGTIDPAGKSVTIRPSGNILIK